MDIFSWPLSTGKSGAQGRCLATEPMAACKFENAFPKRIANALAPRRAETPRRYCSMRWLLAAAAAAALAVDASAMILAVDAGSEFMKARGARWRCGRGRARPAVARALPRVSLPRVRPVAPQVAVVKPGMPFQVIQNLSGKRKTMVRARAGPVSVAPRACLSLAWLSLVPTLAVGLGRGTRGVASRPLARRCAWLRQVSIGTYGGERAFAVDAENLAGASRAAAAAAAAAPSTWQPLRARARRRP